MGRERVRGKYVKQGAVKHKIDGQVMRGKREK